MKIAIISDIHENSYNLVSFYKRIEKENIGQIFFLGDLMNNGIAKLLAFSHIPTYMVWGNNDGEKVAVTKTSLSNGSNLKVGMTVFDSIELDGKKYFLSHYPMIAKSIAKSGDYDAVFFGHTHDSYIEKIGDCLVLNPGELSSHKRGIASFAIYDTKTNTAKVIELDDFLNTRSDKVDKYIKKIGFKYSKTREHKL